MTAAAAVLPAVAVPSAAWLLPEVGVGFPAEHRDAALRLRELVDGALAALDGTRVVVVVVDDGSPAVRATIAPTTPLAPLGVAPRAVLPTPPELRLEWAVALDAALPVEHDDVTPVGPAERVLRNLLAAHPCTVDATVVAVDLGPGAAVADGARSVDATALGEVLDALAGDLVEVDELAVVVPGDLTAGATGDSPHHRVDGAADASSALAAAVRDGAPVGAVERDRHDRFAIPARRPLGALRDLFDADRRTPSSCHDLRVRHVHYLCATWRTTPAADG